MDGIDERGTRVEIARFPDDLSAQLAASRLRAEGIEYTLIADDAGSTYPNLQMVHGVRLLVAEEDEATAREVLQEVEELAGDDAD